MPGRSQTIPYVGEVNALTYAVLGGHDDVARFLCELGVTPRTTGGRGSETLLRAAIRYSAPETVALLIEAGADVDGTGDRAPERPLELAARLGRADVVQALLSAGATRDKPTAGELLSTAIYIAAQAGHGDVVDVLLEAGAPRDVYVATSLGRLEEVEAALDRSPEVLDEPDPLFERPPLLWAVAADALDVVRLLLERGAFANATAPVIVPGDWDVATAKGDNRETALHLAVRCGNVGVVELLLDAGADINAFGWGATPLVLAIWNDDPDMFILLLERGANPDGNEFERRWLPLVGCAGKENELDFARALLDAGADPTWTDSDGFGPMTRAVAWGRVELAGILEIAGAPVDLPSACVLGDVYRVVRLLAEHPDFDPTAFIGGWGGRTPLEAAAELGHLEIVRVLAGAVPSFDPNGKVGAMLLCAAARAEDTHVLRWALDRIYVDCHAFLDGGTALHEAVQSDRPEAIGVLLDAGARLDARSCSYGTPLHVAAAYGAVSAVAVLLERSAPIDARNLSGQTPLGLAASYAQLPAVKRLVAAGAEVNARSWRGLTPLGEALLQNERQGDPFGAMPSEGGDVVSVIEYLREHGARE